MVNGLHLASAFLVLLPLPYCHIHMHIHKALPTHTRTFTHRGYIGGILGFSILPKDTSTCRLEEPGFEPPTFRLVGNPLYLLSNRRVTMQSDGVWSRLDAAGKTVGLS